jgi:hypothetical protein
MYYEFVSIKCECFTYENRQKKHKIKLMYKLPKFGWLPWTEIWFGTYEWESVKTHTESLWERQKSVLYEEVQNFEDLGISQKIPRIYLSIYLSIYYWLQKQSHAPFKCKSPLPQLYRFWHQTAVQTWYFRWPYSKGNEFGTSVKILE